MDMTAGNVTIFPSYESRQEHFEAATGILCPRMTAGSAVFFSQIAGWKSQRRDEREPRALVPGDPSLALVFPTIEDELVAAAVRAGHSHPDTTVDGILARYRFEPSKMRGRSIRTLSGGERCLVALAKCAILATANRQLVMCYPGQWLSPGNRGLVNETTTDYNTCGGWQILGLDGEEPLIQSDKTIHTMLSESQASQSFVGPIINLKVNGLLVRLVDASGLGHATPLTICFDTPTDGIKLPSPVLWPGENGLGKSTLAHLLSGGLTRDGGTFSILVNTVTGRARVLMQMVVDQLFGRSPLDYLGWTFREAPNAHRQALDEYRVLESDVRKRLAGFCSTPIVGSAESPDSLLQAKVAITAARLGDRSPLLILDEPGFGLTRCAAMAFVEAVAARAAVHKQGLLIITHLPDWYSHVAQSVIEAEIESEPDAVRGKPARRHLHLQRQEATWH